MKHFTPHAIILLLTSLNMAQTTPDSALGRISFPLNRVFVTSGQENTISYARFGMPVFPGNQIETRSNSRCEITLNNGAIARIDENSVVRLKLRDISVNQQVTVISLQRGRVWLNDTEEGSCVLETPRGEFSTVSGLYRVDIRPDDTAELRIYAGRIEVVSPALSTVASKQVWVEGPRADTLGTPDSLRMPSSRVPDIRLVVADAQGWHDRGAGDAVEDARDEWVLWNRRRDQLKEQ